MMTTYPMEEPRELIEVLWPESQRIMEHPEAALVMGAEEPATYLIPKDIWEQNKYKYYRKWYQVQVDCSEDANWEKAKDLRTALTQKGITFDSGIGRERLWDWSLDWSLEGCLPRTILDELEASGLDYTFTESEPETVE